MSGMSIKRLIYRMGLRPRPGSVLFSPALDMLAASAGMLDTAAREIGEGNARVREALSRDILDTPEAPTDKV